MHVKYVILNSDIYRVCLSHAFVTDHEEIMGMLIGEVRLYNIMYLIIFL